MTTTSAAQPKLASGTRVLVTPHLGGSWIGEIGDPSETQGGDLVIRCVDPCGARGLVAGHVYAVLPRFAQEHSGSEDQQQ